MIDAVFRYRAASRPTQHLCMPVGKGRLQLMACCWMLNGFSAALNEFTAVVGEASSARQLHMISTSRRATMGMKLQYITPLLAAGAAAVAIVAAPTTFAADQQSCNGSGSGTVCLSPGNVQFKTSPPDVQHNPSGDMANLTVQGLALALGLST